MSITRPLYRIKVLTAFMLLAGCTEVPLEPNSQAGPAPSMSVSSANVFTSGSHVDTWDAIPQVDQSMRWETMCTATPAVGLNANWRNPHKAFLVSHPWQNDWFGGAPWINAWNHNGSWGGNPTRPHYNWTKYRTQVSGNGTFVIRLLADNCSWIYLDGILVGVQGTNLAINSYGLTLNGNHTLEFIIWDGGGAAGGKFKLETTSNPPQPLNPDLDGDGHPNTSDAFPLDPTEWADSDGDGVGNNKDAFPNDPTEWKDSDGDGVGDNRDAYPNDPTRSRLDSTPPVITPSVVGDLGNNGWYTSNIAVSFSVTDPESAVSSKSGCDLVSVTSDTQGVTFTCSATSAGGTASQSVTVKRDAARPTVTYTGSLSYTVDQSVSITCTAADNLSGIASHTCDNITGDAYTFPLSNNTGSATATDNAGNSGSSSVTFNVQVTYDSLCKLVRRWVTQHGVANSLCVKLNAASASTARGNTTAKQHQLGSFINEVQAQSGRFVPADKAPILMRLANALM